jgi:hypothetical protein
MHLYFDLQACVWCKLMIWGFEKVYVIATYWFRNMGI